MKKIISGTMVSTILMVSANNTHAINHKILVKKFVDLGCEYADAFCLAKTGCDYDYCRDFILRSLQWKEKIKCVDIEMFYENDFSVDEAINVCRTIFDNCKEENLNRLYELIQSGFTKHEILRFCQENAAISLELLFDLNDIKFKKEDIYKLLVKCNVELSVEVVKKLVKSGVTNEDLLSLIKSDFDTDTVNRFLENGATPEEIGFCAKKLKKQFVDWAFPEKLNVKSIEKLVQKNFSEEVIKYLIESKNIDLNQKCWQDSQVSGECVEKLFMLENVDLIYLVTNLSNEECKCLLNRLEQKQDLEKFIDLMRKYGAENIKILLNQNFSREIIYEITQSLDEFLEKGYDVKLDDIIKYLSTGLSFEDIELRFGILQKLRENQGLDLRQKFFKKAQISWKTKFVDVDMDENKIKEEIRDLSPDSGFENFLFTEWYDGSGTRFERMNLEAKQLLKSILAAKDEIKQNQDCLLSIQNLFSDYQDACPNRAIDIITSATRALDEYLGCDNLTEYILQLFRNEVWESVINSVRQDEYFEVRNGFWNEVFGAENRLAYGYAVRNAWGIDAPVSTQIGYLKPNKDFIKYALTEEISIGKIEEHFKAILNTEEHIFSKALNFYSFNLDEYALIKNLDKEFLITNFEKFIDTLKAQDDDEEWKQHVERQFDDIIKFCKGECFKGEDILYKANELFKFYKSYDEDVNSFENIESYFKSFSGNDSEVGERNLNQVNKDEIVEILCRKYISALKDEEYIKVMGS